MNRIKTILATAFILIISSHLAFAGYASRSFNGASRMSSFRSYTTPRPSIPRQTYTARPVYRTTNVYHSAPVVVHHDSGPGLMTTMLWWHMLSSNNQPQTVVVQQPAQQPQQPVYGPIQEVAQPDDTSGGSGWKYIYVLALVAGAFFVYHKVSAGKP